MDATPFSPILNDLLEAVPDVIGLVFADWEGEMVDHCERDTPHDGELDLQLCGAHWGVILNHVKAAMHTFHYGDPELMILEHEQLDVVVHAVTDDYYVLMVLEAGSHLGRALREIGRGARALRAEI